MRMEAHRPARYIPMLLIRSSIKATDMRTREEAQIQTGPMMKMYLAASGISDGAT